MNFARTGFPRRPWWRFMVRTMPIMARCTMRTLAWKEALNFTSATTEQEPDQGVY
ncbi:MAG: hypothetical protein HRT77_16255 [Halioglobus sp.]|nr:hypothetical protein [Halioglobus sp.]